MTTYKSNMKSKMVSLKDFQSLINNYASIFIVTCLVFARSVKAYDSLSLKYTPFDNAAVLKHDELENFCISTRHVHLASGRDASTSIIISFSSNPCDVRTQKQSEQEIDYENLKPKLGGIVLGKTPDKLDKAFFVDEDAIRHYNATIVHGQRKTPYWSEYQYHLLVTDLQPNTTYYYKCIVDISNASHGNGKYYYWEDSVIDFVHNRDHEGSTKYYNDIDSDNTNVDDGYYEEYFRKQRRTEATETLASSTRKSTFQFKTAPKKHKKSSTKFAIVGDLGVLRHSKDTLRHLKSNSNDVDFVILAGDISYANGNHK